MGYLIVFVVAATVGVAVYVATLRAPVPTVAATARAGDRGSAASLAGGSYVAVAGVRSDWQTRLTGLLGLLVAVVVGAAALATALYLSVSFLVRLFGGVGDDGPPTA